MNLVEAWTKLYLEQKFKLEEMASTIEFIKTKIDNSRLNLLTHLVKIYLWQDTTNNYNHWKTEIHAFLSSMPLIKNKNKYPNYKQLMNWGFETTLESIEDQLRLYVDKALSDENSDPIYYEESNLKLFLTNYINWLCEELSDINNKGAVTKTEVFNKIDELCNKYHKQVKY